MNFIIRMLRYVYTPCNCTRTVAAAWSMDIAIFISIFLRIHVDIDFEQIILLPEELFTRINEEKEPFIYKDKYEEQVV